MIRDQFSEIRNQKSRRVPQGRGNGVIRYQFTEIRNHAGFPRGEACLARKLNTSSRPQDKHHISPAKPHNDHAEPQRNRGRRESVRAWHATLVFEINTVDTEKNHCPTARRGARQSYSLFRAATVSKSTIYSDCSPAELTTSSSRARVIATYSS